MAKVTRSALKSLVKECLFEILFEATGTEELNEDRSARLVERSKKTIKKAPKNISRPALDNLRYGKRPANPIDVKNITSDPVMAAIFEDTAVTTLQEQAAAEHGGPAGRGDSASLVAADNDPIDLFDGAAQNWAALAFSDSPKK